VSAQDFAAAGLYDPDAPEAPEWLAVLEYLHREVGASIPEMVQAAEEDRLLSMAAFRPLRPPGPRLTLAEAAEGAGVDPRLAARAWRAAGFPDPRPHERRFGEPDVGFFEVLRLACEFLPEDAVLQYVRTIGTATAQIAESAVALMRSNVEAPLLERRALAEIVRTYDDVARRLVPRLGTVIDTLHRHHVEAAGRRYSDIGAAPSATNVVPLAVGFADLSDYTGLSARLAAEDLGRMLARFEATTGDTIAKAGAHVAKRIGDAVMFVTSAPGVACVLALDLVDECARAGLPRLRVGITFGDVIVRHGDFYGPVVNLASRLVNEAAPGTVLTDATLAGRLERVRGPYAFLPAGRVPLAGFGDAVVAHQVVRG
jgi:class 3 adenylate cyclase